MSCMKNVMRKEKRKRLKEKNIKKFEKDTNIYREFLYVYIF